MNEHRDLTYIKRKLHQEMSALEKLYKVKSLGVFGSYVRQEQATKSDIDLLARHHQYRVLPFAVARRLTVTRNNPKSVTVQVNRVRKGGIVT